MKHGNAPEIGLIANLIAIDIFQMDLTPEQVAIISIIIAAGSEIFALIPSMRSNSWAQLIMSILRTAFPKK